MASKYDGNLAILVLHRMEIPPVDQKRVRAIAQVLYGETPSGGDDAAEFTTAARSAWMLLREFRSRAKTS